MQGEPDSRTQFPRAPVRFMEKCAARLSYNALVSVFLNYEKGRKVRLAFPQQGLGKELCVDVT